MLATCTFVMGDGTGGTEKYIGTTTTDDKCADLVQNKEPNANGATWGRGECYAEFDAAGINDNERWRTCLFKGQ